MLSLKACMVSAKKTAGHLAQVSFPNMTGEGIDLYFSP